MNGVYLNCILSRITTLLIINLLSTIILAQNGSIKGTIRDSETNDAVPFANVLIMGTEVGSVSNIDGHFTIAGLDPGFYQIQVSFIGYKTRITEDVFVSNNNIPFIEIQLEENSTQLDEVVIKVDPFQKKKEALISVQSIGVKEIERNPGSNRDISRVIQSFPGVGSTPAFRNDVIIRGGGPGENKFYLDKVEIPVLNHFSTQGASGGPVGIINADFIRSVDFYASSFPAARHNALSGILDFKLKEGSMDKTNFQFALGASEASFTIDGPVANKTSYIFSIRRSYLQYLFSSLGLPFLPTFNDYQYKLKIRIDQKNTFSLISIGSLDYLSLNTGIENPDASQEYILSQIPVNNQWSYTVGGVYKYFGDRGLNTLVISRNMLNNRFYKYPDNDENQAKSLDYLSTEVENKLRYELSVRKGRIKYILGGMAEYAEYANRTEQKIYVNDSLINLKYNTNLHLVKYGLSFQASKQFMEDMLLVSFGLRFDGNNYNAKMKNFLLQVSPRISASYYLTEQSTLNAGVGRYYQQPSYTTLGFKDNTGQLANQNKSEYIGSDHYNFGLEHKLSKGILLSIEGFYKAYFNYPIDLITGASLANSGAEYSGVSGDAPVEFSGTGEAVGFEVLNRWNLDGFSLLASYTFVRSLFTDIHASYIPSSWDSKHLFTITSSKEFKKNWNLGFKWRFVGGLPYTPYDLETSSYVQIWDANGQPYKDYQLLNTERFKAFHQLDVRLDKNFFFKKWALMLYLDIQNAYNFKNEGQDYIVREKNADGTYKTINNGTKYVLKSVPAKSGTILPTVGIMVKF